MTGGKITYAQSSDIKSRAYLEYRKDMKKKAIAELEFLPYLQALLCRKHNRAVVVTKYGGDSELWFNQSGRITQEPDYHASFANGKSQLYEFQYAEETDNLKHFDFKVSKVGKKNKGARAPHTDREFFYVNKQGCQYCFLSPKWIMQKGAEAPVPAWGNRSAYRVPRDVFMKKCVKGGQALAEIIEVVQSKNALLDFQHDFLDRENVKLSARLQAVVDESKILKIVPKTLEGFYQVCFLLDSIKKTPEAPNVWLVYLISFFNAGMTTRQFAQFMYALDFLYFKCENINDNEKGVLQNILPQAWEYIKSCPYNDDGWIAREPDISHVEQTRQILFALNLLEDIQQDVAVYFNIGDKAEKIFATVADPIKTATAIKRLL